MPQNKDNFSDDLEQIRTAASAVLDDIDAIKERYVGGDLTDLEQIQNRAIATVAEIDEIMQRENQMEETEQ
mgnify:CR=1 FL=1